MDALDGVGERGITTLYFTLFAAAAATTKTKTAVLWAAIGCCRVPCKSPRRLSIQMTPFLVLIDPRRLCIIIANSIL